MRKNNARINTKKKSERSERLHTRIRELKCAYTKKYDLSLELNKALILEAF